MDKLNAWRGLQVKNKEDASIYLLGIPFDENTSCGKGSSFAPDKLRELSIYLPPVSEDGTIIKPCLYDFGNFKLASSSEEYFADLKKQAFTLFEDNKFCIFIGGDHSIGIPIKDSYRQKHYGKKIGLIHFDAHADLCDIYEGKFYSHASVNKRALDSGFLPEDILMLGIRSFEEQEVELLNKYPNLKVITANQITKLSEQQIVDLIMNHFKNYEVIYFSLDIDVLDPAYAPGTGTPEAGGISSRLLLNLIKELFIKLPINAFDLVEVSPPLDINNITAWAALKVLLEILNIINNKREILL